MRFSMAKDGIGLPIKQTLTFGAALASLALGRPQAVQAAGSSWSSEPEWAAPRSGAAAGTSRKNVRREAKRDLEPAATPMAPGSHNLAANVGQVFLLGDLATKYENDLGFQAQYTYGVSEMFGFNASVGFSQHRDSTAKIGVPNGEYGEAPKYSLLAAQVGFRANLSWFDRVVPYFTGGMGFYRPEFGVTLTSGELALVNPILFGLHAGPGIDLLITDQVFFGAGLSIQNMFDTDAYVTDGFTEKKAPVLKRVPVGGMFASFFAHAGMSF